MLSENTLQLAYRWKYFQIVKAEGQENFQDPKVTIDLYRNKHSESNLDITNLCTHEVLRITNDFLYPCNSN